MVLDIHNRMLNTYELYEYHYDFFVVEQLSG